MAGVDAEQQRLDLAGGDRERHVLQVRPEPHAVVGSRPQGNRLEVAL